MHNWTMFRGGPGFPGATQDPGPRRGEIAWRAPAGRQWYSAPVIHDDMAVVACPGRLGAKMLAVGLDRGERRWELKDAISDRMRMASPVVVDGATGWVRGLNQNKLFGVDLATGTVHAELEGAGILDYRVHPRPVLGGGPGHLLYPAGTRSHTGADPNRVDTGIWHTLVHQAPDGSNRWQFRCGQFFAQPLMAGGLAIVITHDGQVFGLDPDLPEDDTATIGVAVRQRIVWQHALGATCTTTPAVVAGYLVCPVDDGRVVCLRADDGAVIWDRPVFEPVPAYFQQAAEPCVVAESVLIAAADGSISVLDCASGELRARTTTPGPLRSRPVVVWGAASGSGSGGAGVGGRAAAEDQAKVVCATLDGGLIALDAATLSPLWEQQLGEWMITAPLTAGTLPATGAGTAPSTALAPAAVVLVITNDMTLHAINADDGSPRWSAPMVDYPEDWVAFDEFQASPQVDRDSDTVWVATPGRMVQAHRASDGSLRWRREFAGELPTDPVVIDGRLYVGQQGGTDEFFCLDAGSGETLWSQHIGRAWAAANGIPGENTIYVAGAEGNAWALEAGTGHIIWRASLGADLYVAPVIADDLVVFGAWNRWLWALERDTGRCRWRFNAQTYLDSGACAVHDGALYVPTMGPRFFCLDVASGRERWRVDDPGLWTTNACPAVSGDRVVMSAFTGGGHPYEPYRIETQCRDRHTGELIWTYPSGGLDGPVIAADRVYMASTIRGDYGFYCLDLAGNGDGSTTCHYRLELGYNVLESTIAVAGDRAWAYAEDGYLYAID